MSDLSAALLKMAIAFSPLLILLALLKPRAFLIMLGLAGALVLFILWIWAVDSLVEWLQKRRRVQP